MISPTSPTTAASGVGPYYPLPAWDQTYPVNMRFMILTNMNSEAVLDRETGLVWARANYPFPVSWFDASWQCHGQKLGNRRGWRLPSAAELESLFDPSSTAMPALPSGHPFLTLVNSNYSYSDLYFWTTTRGPGVDLPFFVSGEGHTGALSYGTDPNSVLFLAWCVRGPGSN